MHIDIDDPVQRVPLGLERLFVLLALRSSARHALGRRRRLAEAGYAPTGSRLTMFIFGVADEQPIRSLLRLPDLVAFAEEEGEVRRRHPALLLNVLERERVHHLADHHLVVLDEPVFESLSLLSVDKGW